MMESSASPSGASSHATQTGRPSMWTESGTRKLGRLYVYTTLPLKKILDVIHSTSPEETGPGKDSANKKLNALLDKEPRWLHPRTRTDMDRRMDALATSPTRTRKREFPSPLSAFVKTPASPADDDYNYFPPMPATNESHPGSNPASAHQDMAAPNFPDNHVNGQHVAFPQNNSNQHVDEPIPDAEPVQPLNPALRRIAPSFRRGTLMSTSTDLTTTTLRKALSGYSSGFVTQVKRVMKRYTMPVRSPQDPSPVDETRPPTACSMHDSWVEDDLPEMTCAPPLPGDFLVLDKLLEAQGPCPQGEAWEHHTKSCLCRPIEIMSKSIWLSETGMSERGELLLQPESAAPADFEERDVFGNTLMHFLAARDADHLYILKMADQGVSCRARNSAGQTFLHLLDPSWLTDARLGRAPLVKLLQLFQKDERFFLARDCYGRTLFHVLRSKVQDPAPLNHLLGMLGISLFRDAFGEAPSCGAEVPLNPLRRAYTSVGQDPAPAPAPAPALQHGPPPLPNGETDFTARQARLLEFVRLCRDKPATEDSHGRNGLHCLAASVLSGPTLERRAGGGGDGTPGGSRKRKRGADKGGDGSKERLALREQVVHNLLASGVSPNKYDAAGNTPLMAFAARLPEDDDHKGPVSIVQMLIDAGADMDARNRRGETALHVAVRRGRKLAARTLVQNGARVDVRDAGGRGLLEVADERMREEEGEAGYMRYEAIRAWLSGQWRAVQEPTVLGEWALR